LTTPESGSVPVSGSAPSATVVAIDVGGTSINGARYDRFGAREASLGVATPSGGAQVVAAIVATAASLVTADTRSVGVVVPGLVDPARGVVRYAANLAWRDLALRSLLSDRLGCPVAIDHDAAAATRAEASCAGPEEDALLYVSLGTGISTGYAVDGRVWRGSGGQAGELGHSCVVPDGEPCACGQRGCLEAYASGSAVARRYVTAGGATGAQAADVVARRRTDPVAARVWDDAVRALGTALTTAVLLLDPAVIVFGGGLSKAGPALLDPLADTMSAHLAWRAAPPMRMSRWPTEAGVRGAAMLAWDLVDAVAEGVPA
jgi:glucokinase